MGGTTVPTSFTTQPIIKLAKAFYKVKIRDTLYIFYPSKTFIIIFCMCVWNASSYSLTIFFFFLNFYLFMIVTEREGHRDIGRGRSRLHAPGAWCGIRSRVSRIAPWAKGRRQTAAPPRDPPVPVLKLFYPRSNALRIWFLSGNLTFYLYSSQGQETRAAKGCCWTFGFLCQTFPS